MVEKQNLDLNTPAQAKPPAAIGQDQAEGLRSLFPARTMRVFHLVCALDADTCATISLGTALALKNQGLKTLLVDAVPLRERKEMHGLAYPARYDLAQVFERTITLKKAIVSADDNLWYAVASRMHRPSELKRLKPPTLVERLIQKNFEFDLILSVSRNLQEKLQRVYSAQGETLILASPERASLVLALEFVRALSVKTQSRPIPVLIVGGGNEQDGNDAFGRLDSASRSLLDQPLESLGWLGAVPLFPFSASDMAGPTGLVLPATLYKKLATVVADQKPETP